LAFTVIEFPLRSFAGPAFQSCIDRTGDPAYRHNLRIALPIRFGDFGPLARRSRSGLRRDRHIRRTRSNRP
jgi:hypothetical protein